jgi:hypothetical protein
MRRAALIVLFVAVSCATGQKPGPPSDPEIAACKAGEAAACARLGHRSLAGEGLPRSERSAAAWLMVACESGHAQSCADLGALYAAGRGVRRDDGRACDLGLADACARVGRPVPATPLAPAIALPPAGSAEEPPAPKDPRLVHGELPAHAGGSRCGRAPEAVVAEGCVGCARRLRGVFGLALGLPCSASRRADLPRTAREGTRGGHPRGGGRHGGPDVRRRRLLEAALEGPRLRREWRPDPP